jgi:hypothetical protein
MKGKSGLLALTAMAAAMGGSMLAPLEFERPIRTRPRRYSSFAKSELTPKQRRARAQSKRSKQARKNQRQYTK